MIALTQSNIQDAVDSGKINFFERIPCLSSVEKYGYTLRLFVEEQMDIRCILMVSLIRNSQGVMLSWYPRKKSDCGFLPLFDDVFCDEKAHSLLRNKANEMLSNIESSGLKYKKDSCGDLDWFITGTSKVYFTPADSIKGE